MDNRANSTVGDLSEVASRELLRRVGMLSGGGANREDLRRSVPLSDPAAYAELATRLLRLVDVEFDCIVVRDVPGDRILGYQLSLLSGKPVTVSYDLEGVLMIDDEGPVQPGVKTLLAADTHFTEYSMTGAAAAVDKLGAEAIGAALLIRKVEWTPSFPVWMLEDLQHRS